MIIVVCLFLTAHAMNDSISKISNRDLQTVCSHTTSDKASVDLALDELKRLSGELMAIRLQVDKHFQSSNTSEEWRMMGEVIDRLLFGLYVIFISISFIITVAIWTWNSSYTA